MPLTSNNTVTTAATTAYWEEVTPAAVGKTTLDDDMYFLIESSPLKEFSAGYQRVHGYIAIVVCSFGIVSNLMNVIVLTRKSMISATNYLLSALALVDMITMTSYLPYATYLFCVTRPNNMYPHARGWVIYLLITTNIVITFHTIAMWLTVSLAVVRYLVVCRQALGAGSEAIRRARVTIVVVPLITVVFCVPNYVMYRPSEQGGGDSGGGVAENATTVSPPGYWFVKNDFVTERLEMFNFWLFGVVLKVAPCVLLTVLSGFLVLAMRATEERRVRLLKQGKREESERTVEHNRTTAMLVAVVLFFVLSELPQGVLALLSGVDRTIFYRYYVPLGDVWDIIVLINSAVNFILYCIMSRQFRKTFQHIFCQRHRTSVSVTKVVNGRRIQLRSREHKSVRERKAVVSQAFETPV